MHPVFIIAGMAVWYTVGYLQGRIVETKAQRKDRDELLKSLTTANNTNDVLIAHKKEYEEIIQRQNQELSDYYVALSQARIRLMQVDPNYGRQLKEIVPPKKDMN
jgi:hypothetical protein